MTNEELVAALDDFGDHLQVFIVIGQDEHEEIYKIDEIDYAAYARGIVITVSSHELD